MARKAIQGSEELAKKIRQRRIELGLTIEDAASRAGVGTKTWCRYEAGEAIRSDKCKGVCKALNWLAFPEHDGNNGRGFSFQMYRNHEAWSAFLEKTFGVGAAVSFATGSDILLDHISEDMEELASLPNGSHIGQLDISWLKDSLPEQFLMCYDYDFLYRMKCCLNHLRLRARHGTTMIAHSVMEELLIYLCSEESTVLIELNADDGGIEDDELDTSTEWVFDLFDDMDIITWLYSDMYLTFDHSFHFSHWFDQQFYIDKED